MCKLYTFLIKNYFGFLKCFYKLDILKSLCVSNFNDKHLTNKLIINII